jgi:SsrA-binding protein
MAEKATKPFFKKIATNRRARHDYFIEEFVEAGIELHGSEVKSLRSNLVSFADSYAVVADGECWIVGLQINTYDKSHVEVPDPVRRRRMLLNKREILKLHKKSEMAGRTLVPLEIYFKGPWAKVKLGICRGKKFADRREDLKAREASREIDRAIKARRRR